MKRALALFFPPLLLGGLLAIPLPSFNGCSLLAYAAERHTYGTDGQRGRDGRPGRDGSSGQPTSTVANGTPTSFTLGGGDGEGGEDGEDGYRPRCDDHPRSVAYDVQMANGGDGGDGGRGGHGGHGGDLTVYYQNLAQIRQLAVIAPGGQGGRGGRGGNGALGCRCRVSSWELQTCTGTPGQADYQCHTSRYFCHNGYDGATGNFGQDGQPGRDGQLWLVNQLEPLLPENPTQTVALPTLATQPLPLSRNLWATRPGAKALLAPGSRVNDSYQAYTGRVEGVITLDWQAPRSLNAFAAEAITATLQVDGSLAATFSDELWTAYTTQRQGEQMVITVTDVVRRQDATRLAWGGLQNSGPDLKAIVLDLAGESAFLNTQFRVTLKTTEDDPRDRPRPRYTTVYEGVLSPDQITLNGNRFELALGQLPLVNPSLRPGTYANLEITATRSLGANSAQQSLTWQGQL